MPIGPKGQKRPRDPAQLAKLIVDIATGEVSEPVKMDSPATEFARSGGRKGGKARASVLSPHRRQEIARQAAEKRWGRKPK